jgi:hypothetical protein
MTRASSSSKRAPFPKSVSASPSTDPILRRRHNQITVLRGQHATQEGIPDGHAMICFSSIRAGEQMTARELSAAASVHLPEESVDVDFASFASIERPYSLTVDIDTVSVLCCRCGFPEGRSTRERMTQSAGCSRGGLCPERGSGNRRPGWGTTALANFPGAGKKAGKKKNWRMSAVLPAVPGSASSPSRVWIVQTNSLLQGISQGIFANVDPHCEPPRRKNAKNFLASCRFRTGKPGF